MSYKPLSDRSFVLAETPNEYGEPVIMGTCDRPGHVTIGDEWLSKHGILYEIDWQSTNLGMLRASFVCPIGETPIGFEKWTACYYG